MQTMTQMEIFQEMKERAGVYIADQKVIFQTLREILVDYLAEADIDDPVEIKLLPGLFIQSKLIPGRDWYDPRNRKEIQTDPRIKVKLRCTSALERDINLAAGLPYKQMNKQEDDE